jgi:magnesium chelatase subunit D
MNYPFSALVGQEKLQTALCLLAVHPGIGGILIRGEKGTAKSTAARALGDLLPNIRVVAGCPFHCDPDSPWPACPHCTASPEQIAVTCPVPFVDLPLGATEDRVVGTLDLEQALRDGRRALQPGLLARAHRGILYIDEVNLLADHLVDVLLDAAAMGVNTVEREGVAVTHPARFILIGTMNPEEGDLRPQLLDRFGLMVEVHGLCEIALRAEVVRRRLAFDADPANFASAWAGEQAKLCERISAARVLLPGVEISDGLRTLISEICCRFEVDGLRADIGMHKTAQALAALAGRTAVTAEDIRTAAELVLPHRCRRKPFEQPSLDRNRLDDALPPPRSHAPADSSADTHENGESSDAPVGNQEASDQVFNPADLPQNLRELKMPAGQAGVRAGRRMATRESKQGPYVRAVPDDSPASLALDATLRAAICQGGFREGKLHIEAGDLHRKERSARSGLYILFVVDASGSMAARQRMALAKGAVLNILQDAQRQRDQVALIAFRGPAAELLLPFTTNAARAEAALRVLPTGGRTPLAHALALASEVIAQARRVQPGPVLLTLLSDGKANVPLPGASGDAWEQAVQAARDLAVQDISALVIDTETGFVRTGRARELADALAAEYRSLEPQGEPSSLDR